MKILHIVAGDISGGAARGALWLHRALLSKGVDSHILNNSIIKKNEEKVTTVNVNYNIFLKFSIALRCRADIFFLLWYKNRRSDIFSTGFFGFDFTKTKEYLDAEIIHLHWINGFVDIKILKKITKPIIWTVRDMWPMTGGCHYAIECDKYKTGCGACVHLKSRRKNDLSKIVLSRKKKYIPKTIQLVGISNWVSQELSNSFLFKGFNIETIENSIDVDEFNPISKEISRNILNIKTDKKILSFGVADSKSLYKGTSKFIDILSLIDNEKYYILLFGGVDSVLIDKLNEFGFTFMSFGFLDNLSLRLIYSASDIFVFPSLVEAFGKTIVEAMACGTPVVCFDATGPCDIVKHKVTGYLAKPFDSKDFANGIGWIAHHIDYNSLVEDSRSRVLNFFDGNIAAKRYIALYEKLVKNS